MERYAVTLLCSSTGGMLRRGPGGASVSRGSDGPTRVKVRDGARTRQRACSQVWAKGDRLTAAPRTGVASGLGLVAAQSHRTLSETGTDWGAPWRRVRRGTLSCLPPAPPAADSAARIPSPCTPRPPKRHRCVDRGMSASRVGSVRTCFTYSLRRRHRAGRSCGLSASARYPRSNTLPGRAKGRLGEWLLWINFFVRYVEFRFFSPPVSWYSTPLE